MLGRYLLMLSIMASSAQAAFAQDTACIFEANRSATVRVKYNYVTTSDESGTEEGSGFLVTKDGHILTNAHVVSPRLPDVAIREESVSVRVGSILEPDLPVEVLTRELGRDLALLKIRPVDAVAKNWPFLVADEKGRLPVGSNLFALGFASSDVAIAAGQKTADNAFIDGAVRPWWQTSLPLNGGNSGGPVIGPLGTVVGIAVARKNGAQLVTYLIPVSDAGFLLDAAGGVRSKASRCAAFPRCRHATHGIERYEVEELVSRWGDWRRGGYNRGAFCNDYLRELQQSYPSSEFTFSRDDERSRERDFRRFEYKYFCEFRRRERPVYVETSSFACVE
jgi:S1-C subfamily serine protease